MKILNISTIIPLEGLRRENDIILRIQDYLQEKYAFKFKIAKSLPYVNKLLAMLNNKWPKYFEYQKKGMFKVQGHQLLVYSWLAPPTSNFWINYFLVPFNWIWFKLVVHSKLYEWAKNSDIYLAQNMFPDSLIAYWLYKKYKKPYILNVRGKFKTITIYLPLLKKVFRDASAIITHSPSNFIKLKKIINIQLLPHPVDGIFFLNSKKDYSSLKLISVCRLLSLKHIDWVINTLAALDKKGYNFEYHIVGDGPEFENLKNLTNLSNLNNKILFHGFLKQQQVQKLLSESHVFIMPSFPETLGRVFLEASASNCLCVGHEQSGIDGLLEHQESAIFVNRDTILKEMENIFNNFSADYVEQYVNNAKKIVNQLTWEKIGKRYHALFIQTLSN